MKQDAMFGVAGGLISCGNSAIDRYRHAATYIDRVLEGIKPSELPVQNPTKYELVINRRTAKAADLAVAPFLLDRADEMIE